MAAGPRMGAPGCSGQAYTLANDRLGAWDGPLSKMRAALTLSKLLYSPVTAPLPACGEPMRITTASKLTELKTSSGPQSFRIPHVREPLPLHIGLDGDTQQSRSGYLLVSAIRYIS